MAVYQDKERKTWYCKIRYTNDEGKALTKTK